MILMKYSWSNKKFHEILKSLSYITLSESIRCFIYLLLSTCRAWSEARTMITQVSPLLTVPEQIILAFVFRWSCSNLNLSFPLLETLWISNEISPSYPSSSSVADICKIISNFLQQSLLYITLILDCFLIKIVVSIKLKV